MKARKYMTEIVGGEGNVLTHHMTIKDLEQKLSKIKDQESVKKFLTQITADQQGWDFFFDTPSTLLPLLLFASQTP